MTAFTIAAYSLLGNRRTPPTLASGAMFTPRVVRDPRPRPADKSTGRASGFLVFAARNKTAFPFPKVAP